MGRMLMNAGWRWKIFFSLALILLAACRGDIAGRITPVASQPEPTQAELVPATADSAPQPAEQTNPATPALDCTAPAELTPAMTEGPFYTAGSPERTSLLEADMAGTRLLLSGYVLTQDCQPVPNAWLDFWQTDAQGEYDNRGFRLRGHQFTDENGRYQLETVVPGEYPGRTAHIHVKVQAPGGPVLTSQLFFPGAPGNQTDTIFSPRLLVAVEATEDGVRATFDFIVANQ